jgi:alpha/beta hydrolase family protein
MKRWVRWIAVALAVVVLAGAIVYFVFPRPAFLAARALLRASAGLSQHSIQVAGHTIVYLDGGSGEPLVLLHGFGAEKDNWLSAAWQLRGRYRVLALDVPGFGQSSQDPGANYSCEEQAARVAAFLGAVTTRPASRCSSAGFRPRNLLWGGGSEGGGVSPPPSYFR